MITFLLALLNFLVTVALHILQISVRIALQALKIGAKVGSKVAKQTVKTGGKVVKKAGKETVKVTKKAATKVKDSITSEENVDETAKASAESDVKDILSEKDNKESGLANTSKKVLKKVLSLRLIQKTVKTALLFSRISLVVFVIYAMILGTFVITGTLALTASAGYVALAYDNGNFDTDDNSFDITEDTKKDKNKSSANFITGDTTTIEGKLETLARWYIANVKTYQQKTSGKGSGSRKFYNCDLISGSVGDDCTGFASAYMTYVSGKKVAGGGSSAFVNGSYDGQGGWTYYETVDLTSIDELQTGDILCCNTGATTKKGTKTDKGHHAEVYIGPKKSFGWGGIQKDYPSLSAQLSLVKNSKGQQVISDGGDHTYTCFYRYTGK